MSKCYKLDLCIKQNTTI